MATETERVQQKSAPSLLVRAGIAIALSVLVNVVITVSASTLNVAPGFKALSVPPVAFLSVAGAAGAVAVYWLLHRSVDHPDYYFVRVAGVVLILSVLPDIGLLVGDPDATLLGVVVLMLLHVVVAAISVGVLVYWRRDQ